MSLARIALVVVSLATAPAGVGAEHGKDPGPSPREPAGDPPDSVSPPPPPDDFTPSERIGADSAVSFPVDI